MKMRIGLTLVLMLLLLSTSKSSGQSEIATLNNIEVLNAETSAILMTHNLTVSGAAAASDTLEIKPGESSQITEVITVPVTPVDQVGMAVAGTDSEFVSIVINSAGRISGTLDIQIEFTLTVAQNAPIGQLDITLVFGFFSGGSLVYLETKDYVIVTGTGGSVVADFSGTPRMGGAPLTVEFTDQSTGNITNRQWDFGDGETSTALNPTHPYQSPGTYTVSLTVSNSTSSDTETKSDYITATVSALPPPENLTAIANGNLVSLEWEPPASGGSVDTVLVAYDDGSAETALTTSTDNFELCVRFTPSSYPVALLGMAFLGGISAPDTYGLRIYLDPDADNNGPSGQPVFEGAVPVNTVGANGGIFSNPIMIESGDFYISLVNLPQTDGFAIGLDTSSPDAERSWAKLDNQVAPLTGSQFEGNLVINALVEVPTMTSQPIIVKRDGAINLPSLQNTEPLHFLHKTVPSFMPRHDNTMSFSQSTIQGTFSIQMPDLQGYNLYRSETTPVSIESQNRIDELQSSQLSYTDSNLSSGRYYYAVTAEYDTGESPPSNEVAVDIVSVISIDQARTRTDGTVVGVEGIVTRAKGRMTRIQDASAGLTIFAEDGAFFNAVQGHGIASGDRLRITGTIMDSNAAKEIHNVSSFEVLSRNNSLPNPQMVDLAEIAQNGEQYESELIMVSNLTIHADGDAIFQPTKSYLLSDPTQQIGAVTLFISESIDTELVMRPIPTNEVTFVGVLGQFSLTTPATGYELVPVDTADIQGGTVDSVPGKDIGIPAQFSLQQNYPNPFNPETTIRYQLPVETAIKLKIYNLLGQQVKTLVDEKQPAGDYSVQWHGLNDQGQKVASGVYLYRLETEEFVKTKELALVR